MYIILDSWILAVQTEAELPPSVNYRWEQGYIVSLIIND